MYQIVNIILVLARELIADSKARCYGRATVNRQPPKLNVDPPTKSV
jgi:hypothetical protein